MSDRTHDERLAAIRRRCGLGEYLEFGDDVLELLDQIAILTAQLRDSQQFATRRNGEAHAALNTAGKLRNQLRQLGVKPVDEE